MSDKVEHLCNELKLGYGYCLKPIGHQGDHVFPPEMSRPKYTQKEMDAAVEAARADLPKPSPCGQKFADGTPHSMACWQLMEYADDEVVGRCLICDSEQGFWDASEREWRGIVERNNIELEKLNAELTALREFVRGVAEAKVMKSYDAGDCIVAEFKEEAIALLTPPAASRRCKACSAETVTADESGLCAPCRIVRDGLRASGRDCNIVGCRHIGPHEHTTGGPDQNVSGREET